MKKKNILFILLLFSLYTFSQVERKKRLIKIEDFRKKYPNKNLDLSTHFFHIYKKDTLVEDNDKRYLNAKSVEYEPKDSLFLEVYKDIVYQKYQISSVKNQRMKLWKEPLKIYFAPSLNQFYRNKIEDAANNLSQNIDSLEIRFVNNINASNYIIYQLDENNSKKYSDDINNNEYVNYYIKWNRSRIYDAKLELNLNKYKNVNREVNANFLLVNFYKTLGQFHNTSKVSCESVFSTCNSNKKELTDFDFEIIKYQYSYGICKFTNLEDFEENHKIAKERISRGEKMIFIHLE
ncbi:hypothetical protein [uncultured Polaribacter sp.]|uniref:hypothetical protein n=1 Tax=uncultured Polaribacter sp. TaxID=174711 RepID=UPI00262C9351|nr:hypothetical protein [uncultured Polaribacter sp.]